MSALFIGLVCNTAACVDGDEPDPDDTEHVAEALLGAHAGEATTAAHPAEAEAAAPAPAPASVAPANGKGGGKGK